MNDAASSNAPLEIPAGIDTRLGAAFPRDAGQREVIRKVFDYYPDLLTPAGHPATSVVSEESKAVAGYFTDLVRSGLNGEWTPGSFMDPEFGPQFDVVVGVAAMVGWEHLEPSYDEEDLDRRLGKFRGAVESAVERMPWVTLWGVKEHRRIDSDPLTAAKRISSEYQPGPVLQYAAGVAGFPSIVVPSFTNTVIIPGQVVGTAGRSAMSREVYHGDTTRHPATDPLLDALTAEYVGIAAAVAEATIMAKPRSPATTTARMAVSPDVGSLAPSTEQHPARTEPNGGSGAVLRRPPQPDSAKRRH